jgi:hypothetical protein
LRLRYPESPPCQLLSMPGSLPIRRS